ncbi:hypothetical protein H0A36_24460, partial [Endozoicomonas sp. SM1973]
MVRKLVVSLSSILFFSSQCIANTDHVIEFLPKNTNFFIPDESDNWSPIANSNPNICFSFYISGGVISVIQQNNIFYSIGAVLENNIVGGLVALSAFQTKIPISLKCNNITSTKNQLSKYYFGDFNNDSLSDVIFLVNSSNYKAKALAFYGIKTQFNFEQKPNELSFHSLSFIKDGNWLIPNSIRENNITLRSHNYIGPTVRNISHLTTDWQNASITIQDRNKDGRDDLLITRPGAPDLIAFAAEDGSFPKAEVDTGIGKYNGPSLYKSRFCNRALLTQHPDQNPSTVLFDDVCRTAYVSPPATGTTEVTALTPNPDNAAFCPKLATAQTNQTELLKELGQANTKFKTIMGSLPHDDQLMTYEAKREQAFNDLVAAEQAEAAVRKTVLSQRRTIGQLELDLEDCALLGTNCNTAQDQLNTAKQTLTQLLTELDAAVEARLVKQQLYDQAFDAYGEALDNYLTVDTELAALIEEFKALQDKELALYREFAGLEGATAQIHYQWDWAEQVNRYKQLNQQLKMQWQPLPVTGAKILAELQEKPETPLGDKAITLPAVLYTSINQQNNDVQINGYETALMPKGDTVITSTLRKAPSTPISLPSKINGTIGLSLAGYCPFAPSAVQPQPLENLAAHLTPHIQYEYEEQIKRGYTAKYKLDTFVKTIVRTKKKKKWFKKKKKTYI